MRTALGFVLLSRVATGAGVIDVERAEITTPDGGIVSVTGGAWLSDISVEVKSKEIVRLRAENEQLKKEPPTNNWWVPVVAGFVVGALVAGVVTYQAVKK